MAKRNFKTNNWPQLLALGPPLLMRFYADGPDAALQRAVVLMVVFGAAFGWSTLFNKRLRPPLQGPHRGSMLHSSLLFAMLFSVLLPGTVGWGGAFLAASFGWVFGREIFGGKPILSPALIALAFAIFSFPDSGFEARNILSAPPDPLLALACLPGAAWLLWKKELAWPVLIGVVVGVVFAAFLMLSRWAVPWPDHFMLGAFSVGVLFIAAAPDCAPRTTRAQWLHGALIGALIVTVRTANPDHPDAVVFALLLAGLFAPLLDRALNWGARHAKP